MLLRYQIEWPRPISVNRIWRQGVKGGVYLNPDYAKWRRECEGLFLKSGLNRGLKTIEGPFYFHMVLTRKKGADLDNRIKGALDLLQSLAIIADDKNCTKLMVEYGETKLGCIVTVEEIPTPPQVA